MSAPASPPAPLLAFAAAVLGGPVGVAADLSWPRADASVWRLDGPHGAAILKAHRDVAKHAREAAAYRRWGPSLEGSVPRLLGVRPGTPRALLVERLHGRVDAPSEGPDAAALHRAAGTWLARLHAIPHVDDDRVPLEEAYAMRADAWFARAAPVLPAATLREARARVEAILPALRGRARVPCHRDFSPRNWLADGPDLVGVIDFEHARPDLAEGDLVRLASHLWPRRPGLRDAFLDGYGGGGPPAWLAGLEVLEAVATVAWAAEHDDTAFERRGRAVLGRHLGRGAR